MQRSVRFSSRWACASVPRPSFLLSDAGLDWSRNFLRCFEQEDRRMPRAKQLTLTVPDRPGMLGEIATALGSKKVNIVGMCAATQGGGGMIWMVVDKNAAAKKVFAANGWNAT